MDERQHVRQEYETRIYQNVRHIGHDLYPTNENKGLMSLHTGHLPVSFSSSILRGGHFYQVPVPLPNWGCRFLAMKRMITKRMITKRQEKHRQMLMLEKLSHELLEAFHNQGPVIKKKHDMHKMAKANHALAHYCWW
nr:28S ribosomal protein S7, mitochondrial-like [Mirounga angustirostris]